MIQPLDDQAIEELLLHDHWPKLKAVPDMTVNLKSAIVIEFAMWISTFQKEFLYKKPYRKALLHRSQRLHYLLGKYIEVYQKNMEYFSGPIESD